MRRQKREQQQRTTAAAAAATSAGSNEEFFSADILALLTELMELKTRTTTAESTTTTTMGPEEYIPEFVNLESQQSASLVEYQPALSATEEHDLQLMISDEELMAAVCNEDLTVMEEAMSELLDDLLCHEILDSEDEGEEKEEQPSEGAESAAAVPAATATVPAATATVPVVPVAQTPAAAAAETDQDGDDDDVPIRESKLFYTYKTETFIGEKPHTHNPNNTHYYAPIHCVDGNVCKYILLGGSVLYRCSTRDDCLFLKVVYNHTIPKKGVLRFAELLKNLEHRITKVYVNGAANALDVLEFDIMRLKKGQVTSQRVLDALISLPALSYTLGENVDVAVAVVARMCEIELEQRRKARSSGLYFGIKKSILFGMQPGHVETRHTKLNVVFAAMVVDAKKLVDERGYAFDAFVCALMSAVAVRRYYKITTREKQRYVLMPQDLTKDLTMKLINTIALSHFKDDFLQQEQKEQKRQKQQEQKRQEPQQEPQAQQEQREPQQHSIEEALESRQKKDADCMVRAIRKKDAALLQKLCVPYIPLSSSSSPTTAPSPYYESKAQTVPGASLQSICMDRTEISILLSALRDSGEKLEFLEFDSCVMLDDREPLVNVESFHVGTVQFTNCTTNARTVTNILNSVTADTTISFYNMPLSQFEGYDRTVFPLLRNRQQKNVKVHWSYNPLANTAVKTAQKELTPRCLMYTAVKHMKSMCMYPYLVATVGNLNTVYTNEATIDRCVLGRLLPGTEVNFMHVHQSGTVDAPGYSSPWEEVTATVTCPSCFHRDSDELSVVYGAESNGRRVQVKSWNGGLRYVFDILSLATRTSCI